MPSSLPCCRTALIAAGALALASPGSGQRTSRADVIATIDSIATAPITAGTVAGMSVAVVHDHDTLVMRGYGYADLEFDVPTPPRALYEIGSVTKQFTAAAVLQLAERGQIDLDADVRRYLPDYPTHGHHIPVRRLLDHTSGIKGYTEIAGFGAIAPRKLPRDSLVALFAAEPFDFAPGGAMIYNNSAYFLLGLIIEKVSGMSYAEYVERHLFTPAGMRDSRYCSEREVIKGRANGYDMGVSGLLRAAYLDHTYPYAAGSLCSTVGDLVAWNQRLHGGRILGSEAYQRLITPEPLDDGTTLRYAKGLAVNPIAGHRAIHHGGGIFGFLSELEYFPDHDLTIVVLINSTGPTQPSALAEAMAEAVLGRGELELTRGRYTGDLDALAGVYAGPARGRRLEVTVTVTEGGLTVSGVADEPQMLHHVDGLTFAHDIWRYTFVREGGQGGQGGRGGRGGRVSGLRADQVSGHYVLTRQ